jgi:hypothetical protein
MDDGADADVASGPAAIPLHRRAEHDLAFIRDTMSRSGSFTAMSGVGTIAVGCCAIVGDAVAVLRLRPGWWLGTWFAVGAICVLIGFGAMVRKAARCGSPLTRGIGRRFLLSFLPPVFAGAVLTGAIWERGVYDLLPGTWLLLYGVGVVTGGTFSVRFVPVMGACFMGLGVAALGLASYDYGAQAGPFTGADATLVCGFGVLHIVSGAVIWRYHGG